MRVAASCCPHRAEKVKRNIRWASAAEEPVQQSLLFPCAARVPRRILKVVLLCGVIYTLL